MKIHRAVADSKRYPRETELKKQTRNTHKNNNRKQQQKDDVKNKRQTRDGRNQIDMDWLMLTKEEREEEEEAGKKRRKKISKTELNLKT